MQGINNRHISWEQVILLTLTVKKFVVDAGTERQIVIMKIEFVKNIAWFLLLSVDSLHGEGKRRN